MNKNEIIDFVLQLPLPAAHFEASGEVVCLNSAFTKLLGYTISEIPTVEAHWKLFFPDIEYREKVQQDWIAMLEESEKTGIPIHPMLLDIIALNGEVKKLEVHSIQLGTRAITMWNDFTERLKNENELKNAIVDLQKKDELIIMQSRQAVMGEMLSMIAHQWRQPLSVISVAATGLKMKKEFNLLTDEELLYAVDAINLHTQYLSETIDDFRDFFKPDKIMEVTSIEDIMDNVLHLIGPSLKNNNIIFKFNKAKEELKKISTSPRDLIQVFINIINNAKDVLIERKIMNPIITINYEHSDDRNAIITISDNGGGIQENIIDKIFDPYFSTKEQKNGTGLGLYMSKIIIEKHLFGKISSYNKDSGACFKIELS